MNTTGASRRKWGQDNGVLFAMGDLGEVVEGITLTLGTLNVLLLKQGLNGLLDVLNLRSEPL